MEADEHVEQTSGKTSGKILELVKENKYISIPEMAKIIGVSERSIERNIENLKNDDLLKRVGPAKGGYWKATEGYTMLKTTKIIYDTLNIEIL
nr:winged helix-turn-helix transcriptional regulator [uncultured Draconibacterium sp.]